MKAQMKLGKIMFGVWLGVVGCGSAENLDPSEIDDTVSGKEDVVRPLGRYEATTEPASRGDFESLTLNDDHSFQRRGIFVGSEHLIRVDQKGTYRFTKSGDKRYIRFYGPLNDRYQYTLSGKTLKLRADGATSWQKLQAAKQTTDFLSCTKDADCHRVGSSCCNIAAPIAVNDAGGYRASLSCPSPANLHCPLIRPLPGPPLVAICNDENKCELTLPTEFFCGVRTANPHECPAGYVCWGPNLASDGGGFCHKECGGFAGIGCDQTGFVCEDNPLDDCDPAHGGADCGGICKRHSIN